jgi:hypothetical protein
VRVIATSYMGSTTGGAVRSLLSDFPLFRCATILEVNGIAFATNIYYANIAGERALRFVRNRAWSAMLQVVNQGKCGRLD